MTTFIPYHQHFFMKAYSSETIKDPIKLKNILKKLVRHVGMRVATSPQAKYVKEEGNEGLTGSIGLNTSHASVHIWDNDGLVMFDLYSCTKFNTDKLLDFLKKEFNLDSNKLLLYKVMDRNSAESYNEGLFG